MITAFCNSTRGCFNVKLDWVNLKYLQGSKFFEQHGAKVRSLSFKNCKFPPDMLESIIMHCDTLCSLSIDCPFTSACFFESSLIFITPRQTVSSLQLKLNEISLKTLQDIFQKILPIFPCVKHLNVGAYVSSPLAEPESWIWDVVMNFSHLETLKLDGVLSQPLGTEPKFLDFLSKYVLLFYLRTSYPKEFAHFLTSSLMFSSYIKYSGLSFFPQKVPQVRLLKFVRAKKNNTS